MPFIRVRMFFRNDMNGFNNERGCMIQNLDLGFGYNVKTMTTNRTCSMKDVVDYVDYFYENIKNECSELTESDVMNINDRLIMSGTYLTIVLISQGNSMAKSQ